MTITWNLVDIKYENLFMLENCKVTKINNTIFIHDIEAYIA